MTSDASIIRSADFHLRLGDLLLNLAALADRRDDEASRLLARAVATYLDVVAAIVRSDRSEARVALATIAQVMPRVPSAERPRLEARMRELNGQ